VAGDMSKGPGQQGQSESVLRLRKEALDWLTVDKEVVVLDGEKDLYLGTNPSGAMLWRALSTGTTRTELVQLLVDAFEIDHETAIRDTEAFLAALGERNLLLEA